MKILFPLVVAGALVSAPLCGADQSADERFRIQYGRYSQAAELRSQSRARAIAEETPLCCSRPSGGRTAVEERLRAKLGRVTGKEEMREKNATTESARDAEKCLSGGTCMRMDKKGTGVAQARSEGSEARARMSEKSGRSFEAAAAPEACEHDCCKRATE